MYEGPIFIILIIFISIVSAINLNAEDIYSLETCNIPEEFSFITQDEFNIRYGSEKNTFKPVVFRQIPINKQFRNMIQLDSILNRYGNKYITVTTANTHSYKKQYIKLNDYINLQKKPSTSTTKWGK
jgi:hypothetical protein